jgi:sRNA-binding regulator protein Hfq
MLYECPYCKEFKSMNKKALEQHIKEKHPEVLKPKEEEAKEKSKEKPKEEKKDKKKKKSSKGKKHEDYIAVLKNNYRKVKVKMLTGEEFIGQITEFTTFMFILKTEDGLKYLFKHGVAYIDPIREPQEPQTEEG